MPKRLLAFLFLICLGSLSAQRYSGKISLFHSASVKVFNKDTLKILAVLVNFQEDRDASTFGNGKFGSIYSQDYGNKILDPLPHDSSISNLILNLQKIISEKYLTGN